MTSRRAAQALVLATALSLLGFKPSAETPRARSRADLARACRDLEALCAAEGVPYPAAHIAADCAAALDTFAARFRDAANQLQPTQGDKHEP